MRSRRNVEIGYVLVPQRPRNEHGRVASKCRFYVPAGNVASNFWFSIDKNGRKYQKNRTNRSAFAFQEIAVLWKSFWCKMLRQALESAPPKDAGVVMVAKAPRE
jgi:hypothetical protein